MSAHDSDPGRHFPSENHTGEGMIANRCDRVGEGQLRWGSDGKNRLLDLYLREARAGQTEALGSAFRSCERYLRVMAEDHVPDLLRAKVDPSDLVQDTFLAAHGDFANFRGTTGPELIAWLKRIMRNRIAETVRSYKSRKRAVSLEIPLDWPGATLDQTEALASRSMTPGAWLIHLEEVEGLDLALEKLSPRERAVLDLINRDRLGYGGAGEVLGLSYDQTRREWHRILNRLRNLINRITTGRAERGLQIASECSLAGERA
jgi:RNA polymerase sigma-70 factor, ECF subfamily